MHSDKEQQKAVKLYGAYQKCMQRKVHRAEIGVSNTVSTGEVVLETDADRTIKSAPN